MELCVDEAPALWDAFVAQSPQRSVFVTAAFLRSLGTPFVLVTCREGGRIVSGAPLLLEDGRPMPTVHPFTMYQGLLHAGDTPRANHGRIKHELEATTFFADALLKRFDRCCLMQSWRFHDLRGFLWHNYGSPELGQFTTTHGHAGIIDLAGYPAFDDYLASIRSVRRQDRRKGASFEFQDTDDVDLLDALHEKTFARQGITRPETEGRYLKAIATAALTGGYGRLRRAVVDGVPASATLFLYDDRTAFYLVGANDPEFRNSPASSALLLNMIEDAHRRGLAEVDVVGMNSPARGDYKLSFNADVRGYVTLRFGR